MPAKSLSERTRVVVFPTLAGQQVTIVRTSDLAVSWKKWFGDGYTPDIKAGYLDNEDGSGVILVPRRCDPAIVAHEAVHCVFGLFKFVGAEFKDDELVAHLVSHIIEEIQKVK